MIFQVLQTLIGIAVSLSLAIFAALAYSTYNSHMIEKKAKNAKTDSSRDLLTDETMQRGTDNKQTIIRLYWLLRNEFHASLKLPPMTGQTEREIVRKLSDLSTNKLTVDTLHKIYLVYERARFGNASISEPEMQSFLNDFRSINTSSR